VRLALRLGCHAICEKPLVINPWNLDQLETLAGEYDRRVYAVLQLRQHPAILELRRRIEEEQNGRDHEVTLRYVTGRGPWYHVSWKGREERSGGLAANIGIHFFDVLVWLFGPAESSLVHVREPQRVAGTLLLKRARVRWLLSVDVAEQIFFDSGRADLKDSGKEVLAKVGEALKSYDKKIIRVVGHTDNVPLAKSIQKIFPSNWELSVVRATNVVRFLQEVGIPAERMVASGRGEYAPIASNDTAEGRQKNRRIEIMLIDQSLAEEMSKPEK